MPIALSYCEYKGRTERQNNFFTQVSLQVYNMLHAFSRKNTVSKILRTNQYVPLAFFIYLLISLLNIELN